MGRMKQSLYDWILAMAWVPAAPRRSEVSDVMRHGSKAEKAELWQRIEEAGGYENLED